LQVDYQKEINSETTNLHLLIGQSGWRCLQPSFRKI